MNISILTSTLILALVWTDPPDQSKKISQHQPFPASEVKWKSFMGSREGNEKDAYVLMAQSFMGMPGLGGPEFGASIDQEITEWIKNHPNASAVPVFRMMLSEDEDVAFMYVWLVDGNENLNLRLVQTGACGADKMIVPGDSSKLLVKKEDYDKFSVDVEEAEIQAIDKKVGMWSKPTSELDAHFRKARRFWKKEQFQDALSEFQAILAIRPDDDTAWLWVARCRDKLGQYQLALEAFDKAIEFEQGMIRMARREKAECVSRQEGPVKGADVFRDKLAECEEDLDPCTDLAHMHASQGRFTESAKVMESAIQAFIARQQIKFVDDVFVLEESRTKKGNYWTKLHEALWGLETLASFSFKAGEGEKAFRFASMALSIGQAIKRKAAHAFDEVMAEAGCFDCRLVRALVWMDRGDFDKSRNEIDQAKILSDASNEFGSYPEATINDAYGKLRQKFPNQSVEIPGKHKHKKVEFKEAPTQQELDNATDDELVVMAAGEEPAVSFAALEELVARESKKPLSPATKKKLIADGLSNHRDAKSRWRAQYGLFIEKAHANGDLSKKEFDEYMRNVAHLSEVTVDYATFAVSEHDDARVIIRTQLETRLGGSSNDSKRGMSEFKYAATVRFHDITIDGQPVKPAAEGSVEVPELSFTLMGGIQGSSVRIRNTRDLSVGDHRLTAKVQIELREVAKRRPLGEKPAPLPPLASKETNIDIVFDVPPPERP